MWGFFKNIFSRSTTLSSMLGDVVFRAPGVEGVGMNSNLEWRVKASVDGKQLYVGMMMKPDYWVKAGGSFEAYINFDLDTALMVRDNLNDCIKFARRHAGTMDFDQSDSS